MIGRIRDRSAFERLRSDGVRLRGETLWCSYLPDPAVMPPCAGFAIGRSAGNAVTRNRLRRRLREILRSSDVPPGWLLFGVLRTDTRSAKLLATERSFAELADEVGRLLARCRSIEA